MNSFVDEDMLRNELFAKFGPLQRVTIVRNRETGESRGFAYVSLQLKKLLKGPWIHSMVRLPFFDFAFGMVKEENLNRVIVRHICMYSSLI